VSLLAFHDVHSVGLKPAQRFTLVAAFYREGDEQSRAWPRPFFERHKRTRPLR